MYLSTLTDDEIIRHLANNNDPIVSELVKRLIGKIDVTENIDGRSEQDFTNNAVSYMHEVSGEDHHADIKLRIGEIVNIMRKADRQEAVNNIRQTLDNMDMNAMNLIETLKKDGV